MRTRKLLRLQPMEPTVGGRLFRVWAVAFFMGVAAVSLFVTWAFPRQDRLAAERHERLVTAAGTVSRTDVRAYEKRRRGQGRRTWWEVEVWYTFEVEGRRQAGVDASFHHRAPHFTTEREALDYAARHPAGSVVTVWYDPADPSESARDPAYEPVAFLVPWALGIGAVAAALGTWVARRTVKEARARPLPASERHRGVRIAAAVLTLVSLVSSAVLTAGLGPRAWHLWRQRSLESGPVYLSGNPDVDYQPITPQVRYSFRPDMAHPTVFVDGDAWRFGRTDVGSEEEAQAIVARISEDYRADRLVVYFDPREPTFNALSREYGSPVSARTASVAALALLLSVVALLRLRPVIARLRDESAEAGTGRG